MQMGTTVAFAIHVSFLQGMSVHGALEMGFLFYFLREENREREEKSKKIGHNLTPSPTTIFHGVPKIAFASIKYIVPLGVCPQ